MAVLSLQTPTFKFSLCNLSSVVGCEGSKERSLSQKNINYIFLFLYLENLHLP